MDADLALALEMSAAEARGRANAPLLLPHLQDAFARADLGPPLEHHFGEKRGGRVAQGRIISRGALDQFAPHWTAMIDRNGVAGSICGYVTAANVECLCRCVASLPPPPPDGFLPEQHLDALLGAVRDERVVMPLVEANMRAVAASRGAYVEQHPERFRGGRSGQAATDFFKQWVANFELSDLLAGDAQKAGGGKSPGGASASSLWAEEGEHVGTPTPNSTTTTTTGSRRHFLRYNQFPEKDHATPDEKVRIVADEGRFGGRLNPDGTSTYAAGDSVFMVERFGGSGGARALLSPEEWAAAEAAEEAAAMESAAAGAEAAESAVATGAAAAVRVFAIDLNGHYSAGFACRLGPRGLNTLVLVNSTGTTYADRPSMVWLYDTVFPPTAEDAVDVSSSSSSSSSSGGPDVVVPNGLVLELVAMGFEEGAARAALAKANGSTAIAVDLLVQQGT